MTCNVYDVRKLRNATTKIFEERSQYTACSKLHRQTVVQTRNCVARVLFCNWFSEAVCSGDAYSLLLVLKIRHAYT